MLAGRRLRRTCHQAPKSVVATSLSRTGFPRGYEVWRIVTTISYPCGRSPTALTSLNDAAELAGDPLTFRHCGGMTEGLPRPERLDSSPDRLTRPSID